MICLQITEKEIKDFFVSQTEEWPEFGERIKDLDRIQVRRLFSDHQEIDIQFNPARISSTTAAIDKNSLSQRPCFLCSANQPVQQQHIDLCHKYFLAVNPYPILRYPFPISAQNHTPQAIRDHIDDLCQMVWQLPSMTLFYNGAHCGASAPDHMHFQMGEKGQIPLQYNWYLISKSLSPLITLGDEGIYLSEDYIVPLIAIKASSPETAGHMLEHLFEVLPCSNNTEPNINILSWKEDNHIVICVIPRKKHRPNCYNATDNSRCLISPGCLDMGGLVITPLSSDFHRLSAHDAISILQEVGISRDEAADISNRLISHFRELL